MQESGLGNSARICVLIFWEIQEKDKQSTVFVPLRRRIISGEKSG